MKKLKFLPLFLILCLLSGLLVCPFAQAAGPQISAPSAILLDPVTGEVLFEKDADRQIYPASTTKIMTILLAVEAVEAGEISLDEKVSGSSNITYDLSEEGSTAGIQVGEQLTFEDLLYCAMLSSANEACNIIAERVSGIIYYFIQRMNERAAELGCTATNFVNTHGLPSTLHYTTARDFALIAAEASRHELFMKLCSTASHVVPATNYSQERTLKNSNALLCADSIYGSDFVYEGCTGMKTGHTTDAAYCLVSTAERNDTELLCLVYKDETSDSCFLDSAALLDWGFENHITPAAAATPTPLDYLVSSGPAPAASKLSVSIDCFETDINSAAAVVLNQENGEVFFAKNSEQQFDPSDLTKLMTALITAEAIDAGGLSLNSEVTVTSNAFSDLTGSCTRLLNEGEMLPMESLLYCALLASADDACNAIAEYVGGSIDAFVRQMNTRAAELGCVSTHFVNTHGLENTAQYTTAADFALIALEASRHDLLMRICGTSAAEVPETNQSAARTIKSTNALLTDASSYGAGYTYEQAAGLKTGYSDVDGYCLAAAASDEASGIGLVSVVFGGAKTDTGISSFRDTVKLCDYVFENYSYQEVLRSTENIASVDIELGSDTDYVNLRPANSISLLLPNNYDRNEFKMELTVYSIQDGQKLTAPIAAGEVLGEVCVLRSGTSIGTVKLVASTNVELSRMQYLKSSISDTIHGRTFKLIFWTIILLLAAYIAWVIVYRVKHVKHLLSVREVENAKAQAAELTAASAEPEIEYFSPEQPVPAEETPSVREVEITPFPAAAEPTEVPVPEPIPEPMPEPMPQESPVPEAAPQPELSILQDQAERDYFEEFFRKK